MKTIDESTKIFLQDTIEHISGGNELAVMLSDLLIVSCVVAESVSTTVIYRGEKFSVKTIPGDFDTLNTAIFQFIIETDRNINNGNS